jgi:hypothetical protein
MVLLPVEWAEYKQDWAFLLAFSCFFKQADFSAHSFLSFLPFWARLLL